MEELTIDRVIENKFSWGDVIRYYKPDATDDEIEFILWEKTCYPMDSETTVKQVYQYFKDSENKIS